MKVILLENFPSLGYVGDVVTVKSGYARNFLLPRGVVAEVGSLTGKRLQHQLTGLQSKRNKLKKEADAVATKLSNEKLNFTLKTSASKAYGSITVTEIEKALSDKGYLVDKKQIKIADPIKAVGESIIQVKLHSDVSVNVTVIVKSENTEHAAPKAKERKVRAPRAVQADEVGKTEVAAESAAPVKSAAKKGKKTEAALE